MAWEGPLVGALLALGGGPVSLLDSLRHLLGRSRDTERDGVEGRDGTRGRLADRQGAMESLLAATEELAAASTVDRVHELAVAGADSVLDPDYCRFLLLEDDELREVAAVGEDPGFDHVAAGLAHRVAATGEAAVVDDLTLRGAADAASHTADAPDSDGAAGELLGSQPDDRSIDDGSGEGADDSSNAADGCQPRSMIAVPVGDVGVLQAFAAGRAGFDADDLEALELLASHVATAVDRTETAGELRRERDRLEEFASVVSHDLRNPLTVASGYLELAREEGDPEHFDRVEQAHERMDALIDDLFRLARHGELIGETEPVAVEDVVRDAWGAVDAPGPTLETDGDLGTVEADRTRFTELFANVLENAVEHGGPSVTVRVGRFPDGVYVADDGPGIDESEYDRVFERGVTTTRDGTGYGLAIVTEIAEAHGWDVQMTRSREGGARFELLGVTFVDAE